MDESEQPPEPGAPTRRRRGRPEKPAQAPRIRESRKGRLKFRPGDPHVLDVQLREARNYRGLILEHLTQIQAELARLDELNNPIEQLSREDDALKRFLWGRYYEHKHRDHILATFLAIRRRRLYERLQAAAIALNLAESFLTPDNSLLQDLMQALAKDGHAALSAVDVTEAEAEALEEANDEEPGAQPQEPGDLEKRQVTRHRIFGDAAATRAQLAEFDQLARAMRDTIATGSGWLDEFYITKFRFTAEAREYMKKGKPIPEDVELFEPVVYGPYLKYRWREEKNEYTISMGLIPEGEPPPSLEDEEPWPNL